MHYENRGSLHTVLYDEPHLVEHPNDDETVLVGGGELLVRLVPCDHLDTRKKGFLNNCFLQQSAMMVCKI